MFWATSELENRSKRKRKANPLTIEVINLFLAFGLFMDLTFVLKI